MSCQIRSKLVRHFYSVQRTELSAGWVRYRVPMQRGLLIALALGASIVLAAQATVYAIDGAALLAVWPFVGAVIWAYVLSRAIYGGLYASNSGLILRRVWRTFKPSWNDIDAVVLDRRRWIAVPIVTVVLRNKQRLVATFLEYSVDAKSISMQTLVRDR